MTLPISHTMTGIVLYYALINYGHIPSKYAAKYLNLVNPCNGFGPSPCIDNDMIADTPPCGALSTSISCPNVYDTTCDTPNLQNIMTALDTPCAIMFTYGQGQYMQYILQIDIGNRDSLITANNFTNTGMNTPMPDMAPIADFNVSSAPLNAISPKLFYCTGQNVTFVNRSWNDTITAAAWTFSNDANIPTSTSLMNVVNKFHKAGWVSVSLAVTGNNTGTTTLTKPEAIYVVDSMPFNAQGYMQEFLERGGLDGWPIFNYYNNAFKWQMAYVGCYDNTSLEYTGFDTRSFPQNMTGTPLGDVDDIFTPAFDLTGLGSPAYLNFMSSGATSASTTRYIKDSLEIDYSINKTITWNILAVLKGAGLDNIGAVGTAYTPSSLSDWVPHAIALPQAAITPYTIFRIRYYPGADSVGMSTGNNFYLDHFNFNSFPEDVSVIDHLDNGALIQPNPTAGSTTVVIKDQSIIANATIIVTDVTGKAIYKIVKENNANVLKIDLPENIYTSKGLYLVHVVTEKWSKTEKLVVY